MKQAISQFTPGLLIILLGVGLLGFGIAKDQNAVFLIAGASIVIAGALTFLNALGKIDNKTAMIIAAVLVLLSSYLAFENYDSIDAPIQFNKKKQVIYAEVIQNLKDLRQIEIAYKKEHKVFCGDMDTLINFLLNDSVVMVKMEGVVPDSLLGNEAEALALGIIVRDTTLHPAMEIAFHKGYLKTRNRKFPLEPANLRFVPFSEQKDFIIAAGEITRSSGAKVQVFEIIDSSPFDKNDVMQVGSMIDPTTAGNWKEEK